MSFLCKNHNFSLCPTIQVCVKQGTEKQKNSSMIILAKEGFLFHFILQQKDCKNTYFYPARQSIVHFCNAPVIFRMQGQTDHDVLNEQQQ